MACFFRGFNFVRNFLTPSVIHPAFGKQKEEKIYLSPFFAYLPPFFALLTFNVTPAGASPPTHYSATFQLHPYAVFTGLTPDFVAQEYVTYFNSRAELEGSVVITGSCSIGVGPAENAPGGYLCPYRIYTPQGDVAVDSVFQVSTRCGPQYSAMWNGTEFYCPPEPDCDGPAH